MKKTELFRIILQLEARVASLEDSRADYHLHVDKRVASLEFELSRAIQRIASLELPAPPAMIFPPLTPYTPFHNHGKIIAQADGAGLQGACDQFGYLAADAGNLQNQQNSDLLQGARRAVHYEHPDAVLSAGVKVSMR